MTVRILSIDGGGVRGIVPALVLREIESRLARTGKDKPFADLFHLMSGTSAGGLIALGLTLPKRSPEHTAARSREPALDTNDIVDLFAERGQEIFPQHRFHRLRSVVQAFADKYDEEEVEKLYEDIFHETAIKDALTNLLVTSYDTEAMEPFCFKNRPNCRAGSSDPNYYMRDVARATSAAPTFFAPAHVDEVPSTGVKRCLVDGSVFADNPALMAYVEAVKLYPRARNFIVVSLGTGSSPGGYPFEKIRHWGYFDWVSPAHGTPLLAMTAKGQSEAANHQLRRIPRVKFFRINGSLEGCNHAIDDASKKNIAALRDAAARIIAEHDSEIETLCKLL